MPDCQQGSCTNARLTLLLLVLERIHLVDTWAVVGGVATESDVERLQELVHTRQQSLGSKVSKASEGHSRSGVSLYTWCTVVDNDTVRKIGGHDLLSA